MNPSAATRTTWQNPVDARPLSVDAEKNADDGSDLADDILLQICRVSTNDPQITPEWLSRVRLVTRVLGDPRLCQHARLEAAMTLLASALGQLTHFNPTHLPFGHEGPEMKSREWMERRALERVGKQIVGLIWCDRPPESIAIAVETAVSEAVRVGFMEQQRYDAWRPGMPSGSGWRSVVRVTPYGLVRVRLPVPADPRPRRTPEPPGMQTKELRSDGLNINQIARAVRDFRRAMWEYQDSRDWVHRLTDEAAGVGDDRDRRERLAVRDACNDRNANARQRTVETFPIIMRQAEHLGLDTTSLREAIVRSPTSAEVLRDAVELVGRIEGHLKLSESVDTDSADQWKFEPLDEGEVRARNGKLCKDYAAMDEHDLLAISARWRQMVNRFTEATKRNGHYHGHIVHDEEVLRVTKVLETAVSRCRIDGVNRLGRCLRRPDDDHLHWALATLDELDAKLRAEASAKPTDKPEAQDPDRCRPIEPAPDDRYEWARQIELVRATNQVLGERTLHKGVLSRACADGQVETNGKTGRSAKVRVRSFLTWVSRQHQLGAEEATQIRNAVIGEISSRNS